MAISVIAAVELITSECVERIEMNIELLKRLRTRFLRMRHAEHFQMDVIAVKTDCGSQMCIAGHALELAGYKRRLVPEDRRSTVLDYDFIAPSGQEVKAPLDTAAKEMGLCYEREPGNTAFELFNDSSMTTPADAAQRIQELIESAEQALKVLRGAGMKMITNIEHCEKCDALLTETDDENEACTQCGNKIPPLRALLVKIAHSCDESFITSSVSDAQAIQWFGLNLGDVRTAWRLLQ